MGFKYFMPTLPSTDPAWAAGGSWCSWRAGFPSCEARAQESSITVEVHTGQFEQPRRGVRGSLRVGFTWQGHWRVAPPAAATCGHQAPALLCISWLWFQRCWLHSWAVHAGISSCPRCPAPPGTLVLGCKGSRSSSHRVREGPAASPLGEAENPRKYRIISKVIK